MDSTDRSLISKLLILLGLCILGMFVFGIIGGVIGVLASGLPINELMDGMQNPKGEKSWYFLMIMQGFSHLGGFLLAGLAYLAWIEKKHFEDLNKTEFDLKWIPLIIFLVIFFLPFNEIFIKLNQGMVLPESLKWLETSMKNSEQSMEKLTKFLTDFTTVPQFIIAFIVIAVFAGIGEELIFRGILQNLLQKSIKNHHSAIWISAIIFSAIHFQFYGFVPRMLLGALFGYLYVWTNNLWVPIIAHIANNGFMVMMLYFSKIGLIKIDVENLETPLSVSILFTVLCTGLIYDFYKYKIIITENEYKN